jgi:ankyrin repeat protein
MVYVLVEFRTPVSQCRRNIDLSKRTAVHDAADEGQVETLRLLIEKGADVEARGMCFVESTSPVSECQAIETSTRGQRFILLPTEGRQNLRLLIEKGADVEARGKSFLTNLQVQFLNAAVI